MSSELAEVTAGVIGVGFIGVAHVEALRRLGIHVAGVVGSSPERAAAKGAETPLGRVYESVEAMAADPEIDVIHVASPNHAHADQVRAVVDAGKHVVCEKPLALTSADCTDLLDRARRAGVVNAVCYNIRFYPMCHQARAHVANGDIGEPRLVTGSYLQDWLLLDTDWNWRLQPEQAGELRAVADIGSHWLDLARFITGRRVESVFAELHTFVKVREHPTGPVETFAAVDSGRDSDRGELVREEMSSDDAASILLRMEGGTRAVMAVSQVSAGHKNAVTVNVDGSTDAIRWSSTAPDELWLGHRGRPNEVLFRDPGLADSSASALMGYPPGHVSRLVLPGLCRRSPRRPLGRTDLPDLRRWARRRAGHRSGRQQLAGRAMGSRRARRRRVDLNEQHLHRLDRERLDMEDSAT
jgi:predicted dehydrogenase